MSTVFKSVTDNAVTTTATSLASTGVTSITVATGKGALFPSSNFRVDIWSGTSTDPTSDANYEQVICSSRSGDVLTVGATTKTHTGSPVNVMLPQDASDITDLQTAVNGIENGTTTLTQVKTNTIKDPSNNNALQIATGTGTPANFVGVGNAASGTAPSIGAVSGGDTNVDFLLTAVGTGNVKVSADPTVALGVASKQYVDNKANNSSLVVNEVPTGSVNGSNTAFTTASNMATGSLRVHRNGIRLKGGGVDFTQGSNNAFTFVTAPNTGDLLLVDYNVSSTGFTVGTNSNITNEAPTGTVNSSNTSFTTSRAYIAGSLQVYIDGIMQRRGTDYTETTPSSGTFTMAVAPQTGQNLLVDYQFNLNPSSNADTVDGIHATTTATANQLVALDGNKTLPADGVTAESTSHLALTAGTNKLVKTTLLRQDDTTNTYQVGNSVMLTGWGVTSGAANGLTDTVTFGVTFAQRPIVTIAYGGDSTSALTYGSGSGTVKKANAAAINITTTGFTAWLYTTDSTAWAAGNGVFYQWTAIGEI